MPDPSRKHLVPVTVLTVAAVPLLVGADAAPAQEVTLNCTPQRPMEEVEERVSPYDSATVEVDGSMAKVCYSRPSLRGRTMIGNPEHVPFGKIWRTGANEPTTIHIPFPAEIAGIDVEPGSYSLYTVPREDEDWTVIVNASTSQWGHESQYAGEVREQEVGRATVETTSTGEPVETFTIRSESGGMGAALVLEWQRSRVRVPIRKVGG